MVRVPYLELSSSEMTSSLLSQGRQLYACSYCPYTSVRRYTVKLHERTHTGERPFVCNVCSRRFGQRTHLMVHQKRHVSEKKPRKLFECPDCPARFLSKRWFKCHRISRAM
ncbi:hypothetical protein HPB49_014364 [Dermacentor silvarum]|uniref:Uncharacterized protein n=1 Tax=Dermacentor silvarum TaxID=543639 RepID=A0ACB8DPR5_DERSI|nr:zinc finger protein ZFP2-like [Dermacentor silvarum]KAH7974351.1 hypothetical protein HPB49_014364 [Dermacentor silvarum]